MVATVLVLGAGLVTRPLVHYLSGHGYHVIVATRTLSRGQELIEGAANAEVVALDVETCENAAIEELVVKSAVVISMLPYLLHAKVARVAIANKKHFLTTSYVSAEMQSLHDDAVKAGVLLLNECGVDPGLDHMSAMKIFNETHEKNGKVVSFLSYCGGLPAPAANNNPLGYKFSWAPRGVLLASRNAAVFVKDGQEERIPGPELFSRYTLDAVQTVGELECYPNRDSVSYLDIYPLRGECQTLIRGTYRNRGWCDAVKLLADIGYLSTDVAALPATYAGLTAQLLNSAETSEDALLAAVKAKAPNATEHSLGVLQWLGLFSSEAVPQNTKTTPLDALCATMLARMQYADDETDMIVLQHSFVLEFPAEARRVRMRSSLICTGTPGSDTAMARTVSLPVAIACRLLLEGKYDGITGIQRPLEKHYYEPILKEMSELGVTFSEVVDSEESI